MHVIIYCKIMNLNSETSTVVLSHSSSTFHAIPLFALYWLLNLIPTHYCKTLFQADHYTFIGESIFLGCDLDLIEVETIFQIRLNLFPLVFLVWIELMGPTPGAVDNPVELSCRTGSSGWTGILKVS